MFLFSCRATSKFTFKISQKRKCEVGAEVGGIGDVGMAVTNGAEVEVVNWKQIAVMHFIDHTNIWSQKCSCLVVLCCFCCYIWFYSLK